MHRCAALVILCCLFSVLSAEEGRDPLKDNQPEPKSVEELEKELAAAEKRRAELEAALKVAESDRHKQERLATLQTQAMHRLEVVRESIRDVKLGQKQHNSLLLAGHLRHLEELEAVNVSILAIKDAGNLATAEQLCLKRDMLIHNWNEYDYFELYWQDQLIQLQGGDNDVGRAQKIKEAGEILKRLKKLHATIKAQQQEAFVHKRDFLNRVNELRTAGVKPK